MRTSEKSEFEIVTEMISNFENKSALMMEIVAEMTNKIVHKVNEINRTIVRIEADILQSVNIKRHNEDQAKKGVTIGHLQKCLTERNDEIAVLKTKYESSVKECNELRDYIHNMRINMHKFARNCT